MGVENSIPAPNGHVGEQLLLEQVLGQGEEADPVVVPPEDVLLVHDVAAVAVLRDVSCDREHV